MEVVPISRILLETDSPFLSPEPHRRSVCHPGFVPLIANQISITKKMELPLVYQTTYQNTLDVFELDKYLF